MIYEICQAHNSLYKHFEALRIELQEITGKKVSKEGYLGFKYGSYEMWYTIDLDGNFEEFFKVELNIKEQKMSVDFDSYALGDTTYWLMIKNEIERLNSKILI